MYSQMTSGLPDPEFQAEFYQDVPVKRLIAWGIDFAITIALTLVLALLTFPISVFFFPLWFLIVSFAYRVLTISRWSATLGMRLVAIDLRQSDGSYFDTPSAIMHTLLFTISSSFIVPQIISIIMAVNFPRAQMLHDVFMGTAAVNRSARS
ncbi:RDD family protein [Actibacterium pelagium]|uniref:RDD domain-containing protein n=1 Tax=Actibacterium pelagium TaxID=2029103 RepID=A0A917AC21_9RHOB|nr:RDD family protein [Actibacterium pelagium]GGE41660.1 hypothetical protein GCM10011517_06600 [Actibacterium pelagium]